MSNRFSGGIALWATAMLAAGCGRSTGFEFDGDLIGGNTGANTGGSGHSTGSNGGTVGHSASIGGSGPGGSNGTGGSNGGHASGIGTGSPVAGTNAGSANNGTGNSGATGGGTGGVTGGTGKCHPGLSNEFSSCNSNSDCACPLQCTRGQGGSFCERPCRVNDDCPQLWTLCENGGCGVNFCGAHGAGPQNGELDGTCDSLGSGDGSCKPDTLNGSNVGLCIEGGGAQVFCEPLAIRPDGLPNACGAGSVCLPSGDAGQCFLMCDPFAKSLNACGDEAFCAVPIPSNPRLGVCEPVNTGTGGSTTSGATGGGTGGGTGGTGGSSECAGIAFNLYSHCTAPDAGECACDLACTKDPLRLSGQLCEYTCVTEHDCPDPSTICKDGACITNGCGLGTTNGEFNSTCTVNDPNDGVCIPSLIGGNEVGWCYLGGSVPADGGICDPSATIYEQELLCTPGSACFGPTANLGECNVLCDPTLGSGCPLQDFCSAIVGEPALGVCISGF